MKRRPFLLSLTAGLGLAALGQTARADDDHRRDDHRRDDRRRDDDRGRRDWGRSDRGRSDWGHEQWRNGHHRHWRDGDRIRRGDDYIIIHDYRRYGLPRPRSGIYMVIGPDVLRVDPDTMQVLAVVGLLSALSH